MSKHAIEEMILDPNIITRAYNAMTNARATGSIGATEIVETDHGKDSTTVSRITRGFFGHKIQMSSAFRVSNTAGTDGNEIVIVAAGVPGQYTCHAA